MSDDPTVADAIADALETTEESGQPDDSAWPWVHTHNVAAALGLDPDAPLSLLRWHAANNERQRICEWLRGVDEFETVDDLVDLIAAGAHEQETDDDH